MAMSKFAVFLLVVVLGRYVTAQSTEVNLPACGIKCFTTIMSMSEFAKQSSQELCVNFEFVQALGLCLQENCNDEEIKVVQVAAVKQCDINPGDYRPVLRAASLIIFAFALFSYCMRLLSKFLYRSNWGADDTFMSFAAFLIVPLIVLFLLMISHGVGLDLRTLSREHVVFIFKMFFIQQVTYFITLGFVKASVLAFYLRIFPDQKFRLAVWITQSINVATATLYAILILLQKKPISLNWTGGGSFHPKGEVLNDKLLYLSHGCISLALDVTMLILPMTQVWHLGLKLRKKVGVIAMFSWGILLTCACVIRFYYLIRCQIARSAEEGVKAVLWAYIELCMGVVCGCMPNIRQLTRRAHTFIVTRGGHSSSDREANTGDFRERSLELISYATTAVGSEQGKSGTVSSISK